MGISILTLKLAQKAIIHHYSDEKISSKLISMGMLPGSVIEVIRKAPFGGALYIKVNGFSFALRENEAATIIVE